MTPTPEAVAKARETWNANKFSSNPQVMLDAFALALDAYAQEIAHAVWEAALDLMARIEGEIAADTRHTKEQITGAHMLGATVRARAAAWWRV